MISQEHEWKVCRCTSCQSIVQDVEQARCEGAEDMRQQILTLAKKFDVPGMGMALAMLKTLPLPKPKYK